MSDVRSSGVRIHLLGGFRVLVGPHAVPDATWRWRKARAVVKLLALAPGHQLHREYILDRLWPDQPADAATNSLHQALHLARRAVESVRSDARSSSFLRVQGDLVRLEVGEVWTDVEVFEKTSTASLRAPDVADLERAADLYTGELLPEDRYEDWTIDRRESLHRLYVSVLLESARQHEAGGRVALAFDVLERVVALEPAHEDAHVSLMRLRVRAGQVHEAKTQYQRLRQALRRDLDIEPSEAAAALYREIVAGRLTSTEIAREVSRQPATPLRAVAKTREPEAARQDNLPAPVSSFIGRERELHELERLLGTTRVLTIVGPGGAGKTRLSLQLAQSVRSTFRDGVWWVDLTPFTGGQFVVSGVNAALGLQDDPGRSPQQLLTDFLRSKELLLIFDNCEHVVRDCATLVDALLPSSPGLKVVVTSREALGAAGEVRWPAPPMALPMHLPPSMEQAMASEAVRLFVTRAQAASPGFVLSDINARDVSEICRRLDGMPLAIELAAARVRHLSPAEIEVRVGKQLDLLAGPNTAPARHRTLRAALDWSYGLLSPAERLLLNRLSVFSGSFTLEAAEGICGEAGLESAGVLDVLSHLIDKSLVQVEETTQGLLRYRLLETVRQHARDRLVESGEEPAVRGRHLHWFLDLAEAHDADRGIPASADWLDLLEREHDNLRAALEWARERDPDTGLRIAGSLGWFWMIRGHYNEGFRWLEAALASSSAQTAHRAKALDWAANLAIGHRPIASIVQELSALSKALPDRIHAARTTSYQGHLAHDKGDSRRAAALYAESVALFRNLDTGQGRQGLAFALAALGRVVSAEGDHERAAALLEESLALLRESGELFIGNALVELARLAERQDQYARAKAYLEESLAIDRRIGAKRRIAGDLVRLAGVALLQGNFGDAAALCEEALPTLRRLGEPGITFFALIALARIARCLGDYARGKALIDQVFDIARDLGIDWGIAAARNELGIIAFHEGDDARASTLLEQSLAYFRRSGEAIEVAGALHWLALLALRSGDIMRATDLATESLTRARAVGSRAIISHGLEAMAAVEGARGQPDHAARLLSAAAAIRDAIGHPVEPARQLEYDALAAMVRTALGEKAASEAWEAGRAMTIEAAVECALAYSAHSQRSGFQRIPP
jgi:predicted ATPase/DNA-binding SARP family transcriptional activator